jgi:hypothetical protein
MKKILSAYDEVWVVYRYGDTDISEIFLDQERAAYVAQTKIKQNYDYHRNNHKKMTDVEFKKYMEDNKSMFIKYEVKSLNAAIDLIKETIDDNIRAQERYYY